MAKRRTVGQGRPRPLDRQKDSWSRYLKIKAVWLSIAYVMFVSFFTCPTTPGHPVCRIESFASSTIVAPITTRLLNTETGARINSAYNAHLAPFYEKHGAPVVGGVRSFVSETALPVVDRATSPVTSAVHRAVGPYASRATTLYDAHVHPTVSLISRTAHHTVLPVFVLARDHLVLVVDNYMVPFAKSLVNEHIVPLFVNHIEPRWRTQVRPALSRHMRVALDYTCNNVGPSIANGAVAVYRRTGDLAATYVVPYAKRATVQVYSAGRAYVVPPVRRAYAGTLKPHVDRLVPWEHVDRVSSVISAFCSVSVAFVEECYFMCYTIVTGSEHPAVIERMRASQKLIADTAVNDAKVSATAAATATERAGQVREFARKVSGSARQWVQVARGWVGSAVEVAKEGVATYAARMSATVEQQVSMATEAVHVLTDAVGDHAPESVLEKVTEPVVEKATQAASVADKATKVVTEKATQAASVVEKVAEPVVQKATQAASVAEKVTEAVVDKATQAQSAAENITEDVVDKAIQAASLVKKATETVVEKVTQAKSAAENIAEVVVEKASEAKSIAKDVTEPVFEKATQAASVVEHVTEAVVGKATEAKTIAEDVTEAVADKANSATQVFEEVTEAVADKVTKALSEIKEATPAIEEKIEQVEQSALDAKDFAVSAATSVTSAIKDKVADFAGNAANVASSASEIVADTVVPAAADIAGSAADAAKDVTSKAASVVESISVEAKETEPIVELTSNFESFVNDIIHTAESIHVPSALEPKSLATEVETKAESFAEQAAEAIYEARDAMAGIVAPEEDKAKFKELVESAKDKVGNLEVFPSVLNDIEKSETVAAASTEDSAIELTTSDTVPAAASETAIPETPSVVVEKPAVVKKDVADTDVADTPAEPATPETNSSSVDVDEDVRKSASNWVKDARKSISKEIAEERTRAVIQAAAEDSETAESVYAASVAIEEPEKVGDIPEALVVETPIVQAAIDETAAPSVVDPATAADDKPVPAKSAEEKIAVAPADNKPSVTENANPVVPVKRDGDSKRAAAAATADVQPESILDSLASSSSTKGPRKIKKTKKRVVKKTADSSVGAESTL